MTSPIPTGRWQVTGYHGHTALLDLPDHPTYRAVYDWLCAELAVDGPRVLEAARSDGARVRASLYPDDDRAWDPRGRNITHVLDRA